MRCPSCGAFPLTNDAKYCHKCGSDLSTAVQIRVDQQVDRNLGQVIGVKTSAIHGDVYGGDIYEVQVYALTAEGRKQDWRRFLQQDSQPYRYLLPYRVQDQPVFFGRNIEISQLLQQIGFQQLVVLYGPPGVGKTSLMAAGVIPDLLENGALAVHIHDPLNPVKSIRAALNASAEQLPPISSDRESLAELVEGIIQTLAGSLVLVFDQFERLFAPSVPRDFRETVIENLSQSLHAVPSQYLRVVIVIQESALGQLIAWEDQLPELRSYLFRLQPLNIDQAEEAIDGPLMSLNYPVSFVGDLVNRELIPDLENLSQAPGIYPPHLQIVCQWLYRVARTRQPPHIDENLYREAKGSDGIIVRHFEEILATQFGDDRGLAEQILLAAASNIIEHWIPFEKLPRNGVPPEKMNQVLARLMDVQLVMKRTHNGQDEYALTNPILGEFMPVLAETRPEYKLQVEQEIERIWTAWLAREVPATKGQLYFIEQAGGRLQTDAVRSLLLLYSAVIRELPASPWLDRLNTLPGRALLRRLEGLPAGEETALFSRSKYEKAGFLLSLRDPVQMEGAPVGAELFGPVSKAAVTAHESAHRHTAALALTVIDTQLAIARLDLAMKSCLQGWSLRIRAAELRGVLADADPNMEALFARLPLLERLSIWGWRARRRIVQDRQDIFWLTLGGAFGAGLSLGLLRAVIAALAERMLVGAQFSGYFFWGWILGAALSFGIVIARPLLLYRLDSFNGVQHTRLFPDRFSVIAGILTGTLFFWVGHAFVMLFSSLTPLDYWVDPLRTGTVLLAGFGLSLALFDQPWAGHAIGFGKWLQRPATLFRIGIAAVAVLLGEVIYFSSTQTNSLVIAWGRDFYHAAFFNTASQSFPWMDQTFQNWPAVLAFVDAVCVAIILTIGIAAGMYLALTWLLRWRELENRAFD